MKRHIINDTHEEPEIHGRSDSGTLSALALVFIAAAVLYLLAQIARALPFFLGLGG